MKYHANRKGRSFFWLLFGQLALWFLYYLGLKSKADTKNFFTFLLELPKYLPKPTSSKDFPATKVFFYLLSVGITVLYFSLSIVKFDPFPFIDSNGKQRYFNNLTTWATRDEFHRFWRFYSLWNIIPTVIYAALGYFWFAEANNIFGFILLGLHCIGIIVFRFTTGKADWHMSGKTPSPGMPGQLYVKWGRKPCPKCYSISELGDGTRIDSDTISHYSSYTSRDKIGELKTNTRSYNIYADVKHESETTSSIFTYKVKYRCPSCGYSWEETKTMTR